MSTVNIPEYFESLGFQQEIIVNEQTGMLHNGYQVNLLYYGDCQTAGMNLPWSFSISSIFSKIYQLFLKAVLLLYPSDDPVVETRNWILSELEALGRAELERFYENNGAHLYRNNDLIQHFVSRHEANSNSIDMLLRAAADKIAEQQSHPVRPEELRVREWRQQQQEQEAGCLVAQGFIYGQNQDSQEASNFNV